MLEKDRNLSKVLALAGIFRLDEGRWPGSAVELLQFTEQKGWSLDLSPYHTLTFRTDPWRCLVVEVSRRTDGDWLVRERIDVEPYFFERGMDGSIPLRVRTTALPSQRAEARTFCPLQS